MKILNSKQFIEEKMKIMPISIAELDNIEELDPIDLNDLKNKDVKKYLMRFLDENFINQFDSIRTLRTGNIELISNDAEYRNHIGIKCVLYLESKPFCWRRWNPCHSGWDNHPMRMGLFDTIQEMIDSFKQWIDRNVTFIK